MSQTARYSIWGESETPPNTETQSVTVRKSYSNDNIVALKNNNNIDPVDLHKQNQQCLIASTPDSERILLITKKNNLVKKKFTLGLSKDEVRELRMLQWKISSIETAEMQSQITFLGQVETALTQIRIDLENFAETTNAVKLSPPKKK